MKINSALRYAKNYVIIAILMFLCQQATVVGDYKGYALSLFVALIYCRFSIGVVCGCYFAMCVICDHSVYGIILAIVEMVIIVVGK